MGEMPGRSRLCALCQQLYGSGLRDHVAASDVLRARRMLLDRRASDNSAVRNGLEAFLDELSGPDRDCHQKRSLSVCLFCLQFLPPMYQEDKLVDDMRHQALALGSLGLGVAPHRRKASNLVIQHHPQQPTRPRQSSAASSATRPQFTYRLLTNEMTRVLHVDANAVHKSSDEDASGTMDLGAMQDLRRQERRQSMQIFTTNRVEREKRLASARRRKTLRDEEQALSSDLSLPTSEKRNIIREIDRAMSLYDGVSLRSPEPVTDVDPASAQIVRSKTGRHYKTELRLLPRIHK
ncbi:hypothetical protein PINS_up005856 [Pythium insidiosum]|nr:hypothetical protein PINS_up005856 [Pythium insidiosum]